MAFFPHLHTQALSQNTPLPAGEPDATPTFQAWHGVEPSKERWDIANTTETTGPSEDAKLKTDQESKLIAVTWNVDAFSEEKEARISAILSHITSQTPAVDIIFFQEVSREALAFLLNDSRIRESWFSSEADATNWEGLPFATMTLLSKSRFTNTEGSLGTASIGPVWRVYYPSRYGRDALCCDVFIPSPQVSTSTPASAKTQVRLVNVHLDSLAYKPSRRPRQLSIVASFLHSAKSGLVAGDFNPVLPEDATLIQDNRLVDAWVELHQDEPGFTWGVDGKASHPPNRMDRVAMVGLKVQHMEVMHPGAISARTGSQGAESVPWSDHSGLKYSFSLCGN